MSYKFSIVIALAPEREIEVLESLKSTGYNHKKYEVIVEVGKNPSENRNRGIKKAKGEIIAFIDDDAVVDKSLLKNAEEFFNKHKDIDVVGGPQLTPQNDKLFAKATGYALSSFFGAYTMRNRYKIRELNLDADETCLTSANLFVRRKVFNKIKGFDPLLFPGEDPELITRMKQNGIKVAYSPTIIIYHRRRSDYYSFCKQIFRYGQVRVLKEKLNKKRIGLVFLIPSLFTIYMMLIIPLSFVHKIFTSPFALYMTIALLFSIGISIRRSIIYFPILPLIFLSIHISYGLGMLHSIITKK
ncbi:glycosyltransferase [Candidatus Woesearchaeota archaeon]|nr:glycosyltransferase [Candidatus Woesearchaeota archaeon]